MEDYPLVTIGILSYNRPKDLRQAILSVISQTYPNLEILISDNGSFVEETKDVIREFAEKDKRIHFFLHNINRGPLFNFGFLLDNARGKYFAWLADDDYFTSHFVADCVGYFSSEKGIVLSSNMPVEAGTKKPITMKYIPNTTSLAKEDKIKLVVRHIFSDLNLFYYGLIETASLKRCRFYLKKVFGADVLLLLELLKFGDFFINTQKTGLIYQIHINQTSNSPLQYKRVSCINGDFIERKLFFSASFFYAIRIVAGYKEVSFLSRLNLIRMIIYHYIKSKRFHLIKYDLGLNRIIQYFKSAFFKKNIPKAAE
jgi:glycosyltransferase involved in cell wall biosynthesis